MTAAYSRQLNRPLRYFGFLTMGELFTLVLSLIIIPNILGFFGWVQLVIIWFIHVLSLRVNRPDGHSRHFFLYHTRPKYYVAGKTRPKRMVQRF